MGIISKVLAGISLIMLISGGSIIWYQHDQNESLTKQLIQAKTDLKNEKSKYLSCDQSLTDQNKKINDAKINSEKYQKTLNDLQKRLIQQQKNFQKRIKELKNIPSPNTCEETYIYIKNFLETFKW